jgi:hypothetical protein
MLIPTDGNRPVKSGGKLPDEDRSQDGRRDKKPAMVKRMTATRSHKRVFLTLSSDILL